MRESVWGGQALKTKHTKLTEDIDEVGAGTNTIS